MGDQLLLHCKQLLAQGDDDRAYVFSMRYLKLMLECVNKHAAYAEPTYAPARRKHEAHAKEMVGAMEIVKVCAPARMLAHSLTPARGRARMSVCAFVAAPLVRTRAPMHVHAPANAGAHRGSPPRGART